MRETNPDTQRNMLMKFVDIVTEEPYKEISERDSPTKGDSHEKIHIVLLYKPVKTLLMVCT